MIRTRMKNPVSTTSTSLMTLSTGTLSVQSLASTIGQESSVAWIQLVWWTDSHLCVYKLPKNGFRSERLLPLATRDLRSPDTDELWWEGEHDSRNATSLLRVKSIVKHSYRSLSTSRETSRNPIVISGIWKKGGPLTKSRGTRNSSLHLGKSSRRLRLVSAPSWTLPRYSLLRLWRWLRSIPWLLFPDEPSTDSDISDIDFTDYELAEAMNELSTNATPGPDGFPAILLKKCRKALAPPLARIWRQSMSNGEIPTTCKSATIIPIHKGKSRAVPKNYKPVALTSHLIKIFEKVVGTKLLDFMQENNLFSYSQHGFRGGRSCLSQLLCHFDKITSEL